MPDSTKNRQGSSLSEREQMILRSVVDRFVQTGSPVGSRVLAKYHGISLSPASIRNTMSDLEVLGYLDHPHPSAGRVPTETGYRIYVDDLMDEPELPLEDRQIILDELIRFTGNADELWRESSRLLGRLSNLLGVVLSPKLSTGVFHRMDVVSLSSSRVMFVISVESGLVKTIVLEVEVEFEPASLTRIVSIVNERLSGLTLEEIRVSFADRVQDIEDSTGLLGVALKHAPELFDELPEARRLQYAGTQHIVSQPEFQQPAALRNIMELLENENVVVHLLEKPGKEGDHSFVTVRIGGEHGEQKARDFSIVTAEYRVGNTAGTIGVVGPIRMDYARMIALVNQMGLLLSQAPDDWRRMGFSVPRR